MAKIGYTYYSEKWQIIVQFLKYLFIVKVSKGPVAWEK
jgi:hypothetical protein